MRTTIFTLFMILAMCVTAFGYHLSSDPSRNEASHWQVVLDNGTVYNGTTVNGTIYWPIDNLPTGAHQGQAHFGQAEWKLDSEGNTQIEGIRWSPPTDFLLIRYKIPNKPTKIKIKE